MHQSTIDALKTFQEKGNLIFIASARGSLPETIKGIDFDGFIGNDGHYITYKDEVWLDDLFTIQDVKHQIEVYKKYHGRYMFSGHDAGWNCFWEDEYIQKHSKMFHHTTKKPDYIIEDYQEEDVHAIACCVLFENADDLYGAYHELKDDYTMVVYDTGLIRMDVYRKGFRKGTACEYVYQKLGICKEDTYAFGDGVNDVEMIQLVGHGVAMGNAVEELKEVADEVTLSVDDHGIAAYFDKYLNK